MDGWRGTVATTTIFVAASVTDWLDGYIARKVFPFISNTTIAKQPYFFFY